ncbi:hypothetical protein FKP32DRAFT_1655740 [Trametes sanguinea]|nr:hypothetical protein FKP32DRAFT_1655740 [Trametes sanguinea]
MTRGVRSSGARLVRGGSRLVQGLRQKSRWFVKNIVSARPNVRPFAGLRSIHRPLYTLEIQHANEVQVTTGSQETLPGEEAGGPVVHSLSSVACDRTLKSVRRLKRIDGCAGANLSPVSEEYDSDVEDFGHQLPHMDEDSSMQSEYHTAISHLTEVSALGATVPTPHFNENGDVVFSRICLQGSSRQLPAVGSFAEERAGSQPGYAPVSPTTANPGSSSTRHLTAPSLVLTLPTPQIAHSPVFVPRSPITLAKYVEATTPLHMLTSLSPQQPISTSTSLSLSPAPSLPICERACLSQLEYGIVCRSCEKQWLACKLWYQAHDGGRRQFLTEPYIKPAESTASVRAVMRVLGVPGDAANTNGGVNAESTRGLGFGSSFSFKQELPFRVLATSSDTSGPRVRFGSSSNSGDGSGGSSCTTRLRKWTANAKRVMLIRQNEEVQGRWTALRALWSASVGVLFPQPMPRDGPFSGPSPSMSDDYSVMSGGLHIDGHQWPPSPATSLSFGSSTGPPADAIARVTSGSRFVEHLWWSS